MDPFSLGAMSGVIKEAGSAATAARALLGGRGAAEDAVPRFGLGVPETEREKCGNIDGRVQIGYASCATAVLARANCRSNKKTNSPYASSPNICLFVKSYTHARSVFAPARARWH
jgi:hypothetical protein